MSETFDPDRALRTLLALVSDEGIREVGVDRAADLVRDVVAGLDEHLAAGGALPARWAKATARPRVASIRPPSSPTFRGW